MPELKSKFNYPAVTLLILLCALVFLMESIFGWNFGRMLGAIPVDIIRVASAVRHQDLSALNLHPLSTLALHVFVHADIEHLAVNMLFLWIYGSLVEEIYGKWMTTVFFIVCGISGALYHAFMNTHSEIPMVGASGSISGLAGIYLGLMLRWRMPNPHVWPLAHPIEPMRLGILTVAVAYYDYTYLVNRTQTGVAHAGHLGGLFCGLVIALITTEIYKTREEFLNQ